MATETIRLAIQGMTCENCARGVERTLSAVPGVSHVKVDLKGASASVACDPALATRDALAEAVRDLGYDVTA